MVLVFFVVEYVHGVVHDGCEDCHEKGEDEQPGEDSERNHAAAVLKGARPAERSASK